MSEPVTGDFIRRKDVLKLMYKSPRGNMIIDAEDVEKLPAYNIETTIDAKGFEDAVNFALENVNKENGDKYAALAIGSALMWIAEELHVLNEGRNRGIFRSPW